jgi:hypothetical protein
LPVHGELSQVGEISAVKQQGPGSHQCGFGLVGRFVRRPCVNAYHNRIENWIG